MGWVTVTLRTTASGPSPIGIVTVAPGLTAPLGAPVPFRVSRMRLGVLGVSPPCAAPDWRHVGAAAHRERDGTARLDRTLRCPRSNAGVENSGWRNGRHATVGDREHCRGR